jgi:hypothetical protein
MLGIQNRERDVFNSAGQHRQSRSVRLCCPHGCGHRRPFSIPTADCLGWAFRKRCLVKSNAPLTLSEISTPSRNVLSDSSAKQWRVVITAGAGIRAVLDLLSLGCPFGRPFLILGTATEGTRRGVLSWRTSGAAGYAGSLRAVFRASICAESAALRMASGSMSPRRCQRSTTACDAGASGNVAWACATIVGSTR